MMDKNNLLAPNFKMTPRPPPSPTPLSTEEAAPTITSSEENQNNPKGWTELKITGNVNITFTLHIYIQWPFY